MDQNACLQTPTHYTHYGVCYVGNPTFQLHSVNFGATTAVPEPGVIALLALGWAFLLVRMFKYRARTTERSTDETHGFSCAYPFPPDGLLPKLDLPPTGADGHSEGQPTERQNLRSDHV